jgi:hypothetical protein
VDANLWRGGSVDGGCRSLFVLFLSIPSEIGGELSDSIALMSCIDGEFGGERGLFVLVNLMNMVSWCSW